MLQYPNNSSPAIRKASPLRKRTSTRASRVIPAKDEDRQLCGWCKCWRPRLKKNGEDHYYYYDHVNLYFPGLFAAVRHGGRPGAPILF
jgi:hypothetical protein